MSIARTPAGARDAYPTLGAGLLAAVALLLAATIWHATSPANTDIAWLLTVGEHVLDGARPYADIIETNPPGSVLLYLPAVVLGRALGVAPELMVVTMTVLACVGSLALSAAILRRMPGLDMSRTGPLLGFAASILLVLPGASFGQREHVILLTTLPLLAVLTVRAAGSRAVPILLGLAAATGAGIGFSIKPHYALGLGGPLLLLFLTGGWRGLLVAWEVWFALALAGALGALQLAVFPDFTQTILPLLLRVYLPARQSWTYLFTCPSAVLTATGLVVYAALRRHRRAQPIGDMAILASAGFFGAYLMQGKGWPYHAYPAIASILIGIGALLTDAEQPSAGRRRTPVWIGGAVAALVAVVATFWFDTQRNLDTDAPGLEQAVTALGPHPRLMSLHKDIAVGHPFVRQIGGQWVGTLMSSWISLEIHRLTGTYDRDGPYGADLIFQDRIMASDIRDRKPDAILATAPGWSEWIASQPEVSRALEDYRPAGTFGSVMLWTRNYR